MRRAYKSLFWRATRPENTADYMNEWKYFLKYNINISIITCFKQYLPSIIQSVKFTGRVARQNNGLYVLHMIVKLAYCKKSTIFLLIDACLVPLQKHCSWLFFSTIILSFCCIWHDHTNWDSNIQLQCRSQGRGRGGPVPLNNYGEMERKGSNR